MLNKMYENADRRDHRCQSPADPRAGGPPVTDARWQTPEDAGAEHRDCEGRRPMPPANAGPARTRL